jgi:hypothetical protein
MVPALQDMTMHREIKHDGAGSRDWAIFHRAKSILAVTGENFAQMPCLTPLCCATWHHLRGDLEVCNDLS